MNTLKIYKKHISTNSGIRVNNGNFVFDYTYNYPDDIIHIVSPQLYRSEHGNHIYWFGYKFNSQVSSKTRTKFINYIKGIGENKISDKELRRLIELPLSELDKQINLYDIDCFVYPKSGRSQLVSTMISIINRWTSHEMDRMSFELVKSAPIDIQFDWKSFESENDDGTNRYKQMKDYVENNLMPAIHELDYFSIAHSVKSKYRKYIMNYLNFKLEDIDKFAGLNGSNILIVDDINTSGSTLEEIFRIINKINHTCNIFVYTLIGN